MDEATTTVPDDGPILDGLLDLIVLLDVSRCWTLPLAVTDTSAVRPLLHSIRKSIVSGCNSKINDNNNNNNKDSLRNNNCSLLNTQI